MVPKEKSQSPLRESVVTGWVSTTVAPLDGLGVADGSTVVAVTARETATGLGVAGAGVREGAGNSEAVGDGAGVLVVSVTAVRRTIVGVDEAAPALPKNVLQPVNSINEIKNKPIRVVFFIINPPSGYPIQKPLVDAPILQP
jgi:hypothetical protein